MFHKATKQQSKLRAALFGPSGAGKTYSALRIAKGIGGRVAVIDTERGTARKYSDRFEFDVCELADRSIDGYIGAMRAAADAGYAVLIIDSLTHAWKELVAEVERLANAKYKGNTWSAWSEGTPKQTRFIDALLDLPLHVIATMRSKTEWNVGSDQNGKTRPVRVGLTPEQGKGSEYEFDLLLELDVNHVAACIKDRTGRFQDRFIERPDERFGAELAAWLTDGAPPPPRLHEIAGLVTRAERVAALSADLGKSVDAGQLVQHLERKHGTDAAAAMAELDGMVTRGESALAKQRQNETETAAAAT